MKRRPLLFNSIVYGSFYTGAEFTQQSYNLKFRLLEKQQQRDADRFVAIGASTQNKELPRSNENSVANLEPSDYDWKQLQRYAVYGCFMAGPILHGWYKWLDRIFRGTAMRTVTVKLLADQFILTPPLLVLFFVSMSYMESRKDLTHECKIKFVKTFQTSCLYWIPVQFVNFLVVPPALRVLYVSVAAFCWVNILCYLKRLPVPNESLRDDD